MRTIQFTVSDDEYAVIKKSAHDIGLGGMYAASTFARMVVMQTSGASSILLTPEGWRKAFLVSFSEAETKALAEYVRIKKGFAGPDPIATFIHKAAFDIMNKYPPKGGHGG